MSHSNTIVKLNRINNAASLIISSPLETKRGKYDYEVIVLERSLKLKAWPGINIIDFIYFYYRLFNLAIIFNKYRLIGFSW
jgi:hypothetical protein